MAMTSEEVLLEVNKVFVRVFERPGLVVSATTTASDVEGWDSLNHTLLIGEVQKHFNVKFALKEVMKFQNVGDLCAVLRAKLGG